MEVKDVQNARVVSNDAAVQTNLQRPARSLTQTKVKPVNADAAAIEVDKRARAAQNLETRNRANEVINAVNVAAEATGEIEKLVNSIDGIVEQVSSKELSEPRKQKLESEANQLVEEIKRKAREASSGTVRPLAGDKIRLEIEEKLGKTLEIILPDDAKNAFGIGEIKFSKKEAIIQVRTNVAQAKERIEDLRTAVETSQSAVRSSVTEIEVAMQNSEAAETSIRDLDHALRIASDTRSGISSNPEAALKSVGNIDRAFLDLLK